MARAFSVVIERDSEGDDVASVPALRGCHTQAKSLDEPMARAREVVEPLGFVGVQKITVA